MPKSWEDIKKERMSQSSSQSQLRDWREIAKSRGVQISDSPDQIIEAQRNADDAQQNSIIPNIPVEESAPWAKSNPILYKTLGSVGKVVSAPLRMLNKVPFLDRVSSQAANTILANDYNELPETGSKISNTAADMVGTVLGYTVNLPGTQTNMLKASNNIVGERVGKAASKATKDLSPRLSKALSIYARGAAEGSSLALLEGGARDMEGKELGKKVLAEGAIGGLMDLGVSALGSAIAKKLKGNVPKTVQEAITKAKEIEAKPNKTSKEIEDWYALYEYLDEINRSDPAYIKAEAKFNMEPKSIVDSAELNALNSSTKPSKNLETDIKGVNILPDKKIAQNQMEVAVTKVNLPDNIYDLQRLISKMEVEKEKGFDIDLQLFAEAKKKLEEVSKLYKNTLRNSNFLTDVEKQALDANDFVYNVKPELESLDKARKRIELNLDGEIENLKIKDAYTGEDFDTAMEILKEKYLEEARQSGDYSQVREWLKNIRKYSTESGRAVQAHAKYSRTPEGMAAAAQRTVDKVNDALKRENPNLFRELEKKGKLADLSDSDMKTIIEGMEKYQGMPEGWEKESELYKVLKVIADKIPPKWIDKYKGLQRIMYLANPKTILVRNPLGNLILQAAETVKDIPAAVTDRLISGKTGQRTTNMPNFQRFVESGKGFKQGLDDAIRDIKAGVDTSPSRGKMETPRGKVFESKILNQMDDAVSKALQLGDRPFFQAAYNDRITQLKQISKSDVITDIMEQDAYEYALERTFQDDTGVSKLFQWVKSLGNRLDTNDPMQKALKVSWETFGNTVMPFTKTPANILNKLVEYTPGGFIKAMTQLGMSKKYGVDFNQKYFVDNIGRALTGTAIMALGYAGAQKGFIKGKPDRDKEIASIERTLGIQPYSFVVNGKSYTFDWAQPISALLAIGSDAFYGGKNKDTFAEQLQGMAGAAGNTFFNMSMMQSLTRLFNQYNPTAGVVETIKSGATSLLSPSLVTQTTKIIDPYVRETEGKNIKQVQSKIPGLSQTLPSKVDLFGRPIEQFEGRNIAAKAFESYLSPGYYATGKNSTPELKEVYRVYKATDIKNVFPRIAPKQLTHKGQIIKLSVEEQQEFQKEMGQANLNDIKELTNSRAYKIHNDDKKAELLQRIVDSNFNKTRKKFITDKTKK